MGAAMTHITIWLVALTLTGSPATAGMCAVVCGHALTPSAHCHEALTVATPAAVTGESTCGSTVANATYVNDRTSGPQASALAAAMPFAAGLAPLEGVDPPLTVPIVVGWLAPPLVLRI
jgi:hypothetical protein